MNFERGKDIKKTLNVGVYKTSPDVFSIMDYSNALANSGPSNINHSACGCILQEIVEGRANPENYYFYEILERDSIINDIEKIDSNLTPIAKYRGRYVKYKNQLFLIPTK